MTKKKRNQLSQQSGHRILTILKSASLMAYQDLLVFQFPKGTPSLEVDKAVNKLQRALSNEIERLATFGKKLEIWKESVRFLPDGTVRHDPSQGKADPSLTIYIVKIRMVQRKYVRKQDLEHLVPTTGFFQPEYCTLQPPTMRQQKIVDYDVAPSIRPLSQVPEEDNDGKGKYLDALQAMRRVRRKAA